MSGHSKWHNIKRKKEATDLKKGKIFSKLSRQITIAAKKGGGDENSNPSLRLAIEKAKEANMPKDNIEKAIKKGAGDGINASIEEVVYEGFGPNGGAFMILAITDNNNRTVAEIKNIFNKCDGSLGNPGSTTYIFVGEEKIPAFEIEIEEGRTRETVKKLVGLLDDHDDVQEVYSNYTL